MIDVGFTRLGNEETLLREERSDGTVAVTLVRRRAGGPQLGVGGDVRLGANELSVGAELRLALLVRSGSGQTYVAADRRAADDLERRLRLSVLARRPETTIDNPVGGLPVLSRPMPRLPAPDQSFHEHGRGLSLDAAASRRAGQGGAAPGRRGHRRGALGQPDGPADGVPAADGRAGRIAHRAVGGRRRAATGRELYAVTVDRDGRPLDLEVLRRRSSSAPASDVPTAVRNLRRRRRRAARRMRGSSRSSEHLDLTRPREPRRGDRVPRASRPRPRSDGGTAAVLDLRRRSTWGHDAGAALRDRATSTRGDRRPPVRRACGSCGGERRLARKWRRRRLVAAHRAPD